MNHWKKLCIFACLMLLVLFSGTRADAAGSTSTKLSQKIESIHKQYLKEAASDVDKLWSIYYYIRNNIVCDELGNIEGKETLLEGEGSSEGIAEAFLLLASREKIEGKLVQRDATWMGEYHAWVMAKLNKKWYHIEPQGGLFLASDQDLREYDVDKYRWDESEYPACSSNYFSNIKTLHVTKKLTSMIQEPLYYFYKNVTTVIYDEGVTRVRGREWYCAPNLKKVQFADSVVSIGAYAFQNVNFKSIVLPENIKSIEEGAFLYCYEMESVTLPEKLETIGKYAFQANNIKTLIIPDSVKEIGDYAFAYNRKLTAITLSDHLTELGVAAFRGCESVTSIHFPASLNVIKSYAFYDAASLKEIVIEEGIKRIDSAAFSVRYDTPISKVIIPESVEDISLTAFGENGAVIYGYQNSYAELFAAEAGLQFVVLEK